MTAFQLMLYLEDWEIAIRNGYFDDSEEYKPFASTVSATKKFNRMKEKTAANHTEHEKQPPTKSTEEE